MSHLYVSNLRHHFPHIPTEFPLDFTKRRVQPRTLFCSYIVNRNIFSPLNLIWYVLTNAPCLLIPHDWIIGQGFGSRIGRLHSNTWNRISENAIKPLSIFLISFHRAESLASFIPFCFHLEPFFFTFLTVYTPLKKKGVAWVANNLFTLDWPKRLWPICRLTRTQFYYMLYKENRVRCWSAQPQRYYSSLDC